MVKEKAINLKGGGKMGRGKKKIGLIGCGKMGGALLAGILRARLISPKEIICADYDRRRLDEIRGQYNVETTTRNKRAAEADIVIIAVKPQVVGEVLDDISSVIKPSTVLVSIAAGITSGFIEKRLAKEALIIRAMPNTPAMVGEGMTALSVGKRVKEEDLSFARNIFEAVGKTVVVKEDLMDAVTGLSGSGPAYIFTIIEALADGGVQMGLDRDTARLMAAQTVLGAARLVMEGNRHPAELRDMVTSPGGTTIAGLRVMEEGKIRATLMAAVEAATRRSQALARG